MNEQTPKTTQENQSLNSEELAHMQRLADAREEVARRAMGHTLHNIDGVIVGESEFREYTAAEAPTTKPIKTELIKH